MTDTEINNRKSRKRILSATSMARYGVLKLGQARIHGTGQPRVSLRGQQFGVAATVPGRLGKVVCSNGKPLIDRGRLEISARSQSQARVASGQRTSRSE